METSNLGAYSKMNGENSNFIFPHEDDNMLDKLRSCSIIPKEFSEFQVFVRTLTGNTISDDIIQEAWKHIYKNESHEELNSNLLVRDALSSSIYTKCQVSALRNNSSKITRKSRKIGKKKFSSQSIDIADDSSKHVEECGVMETEKNNRNVLLTVHNNISNLVTEPEPSDSISSRVRNGQYSSSNVSRTIKQSNNQTNVAYSVNEISDYLAESDLVFADIASKSSDLSLNLTLDNDCEDTLSLSQEVDTISKKNKRKNATHPVAITSNPAQASFLNRNNDVKSNLKKDDDSSSDCEVIEIVSLNKPVYNDSESEVDKSVSECEKSDSDNSIEILVTKPNIKQPMNKSEETDCPVHGRNDLLGYTNSCGSFKTSYCIDGGLQTSKDSEKFSNLCFKKKKENAERKRKKKKKYNLLKSEVKTLKSLLVQLLTSLQNTSINVSNESTESIPCLLKKNVLNGLQENSDRSKTSNGSFLNGRTKNKSKVEFPQKTKTPLVVGGNMPINGDQSKQKKQKITKNLEDVNDCHEPVQNVDVETGTSDGGKREKFMWREIIADTLKSWPGRQMPVEKLKRLVIAKYYFCRGCVSKNTTVKFFRYLHTTSGVIVDKDQVFYFNKHNIKLSSISKQRKQFVLKTVMTTKEYKMS